MFKSKCKSLEVLSSQGYWDDIFSCLNIDANSTIELDYLKEVPAQPTDMWLDDHKATLNTLKRILGFILALDDILFILLLVYVILFVVKFVRLRLFRSLLNCGCVRKCNSAHYRKGKLFCRCRYKSNDALVLPHILFIVNLTLFLNNIYINDVTNSI